MLGKRHLQDFDTVSEFLKEYPEYNVIPSYTISDLMDYVKKGMNPGGFIRSILCNDLVGAYDKADHLNKPVIGKVVQLVYNRTPDDCWAGGFRFTKSPFEINKDIVKEWIKNGGTEGQKRMCACLDGA